MIAGLDSAQPPTPDQARAARAAGVAIWSGYIATRPGVNLYRVWTRADFENAKLVGAMPIAYASGLDDPAACKALASAWGVRLCLDVENGIRPDGPWVADWLAKSGAGLYGNASVHIGRIAAFHILSLYLPGGVPTGSWPASGYGPRPARPCGWQWQGTHSEFGVGVDRTLLDPWFGGNTMPDSTPLPAGWRTETLGGQFSQIADPIVLQDGSLHIFGVGADGQLWHWIYKAA
jgi:hypothetical protein